MIVIGPDGQYEFEGSTKTLKVSDHPVYQAQIELNLSKGEWIGAPNAGHNIEKRTKKTPEKVEQVRKELRFYLSNYNPDIREAALKRASASIPVIIDEDAFNV